MNKTEVKAIVGEVVHDLLEDAAAACKGVGGALVLVGAAQVVAGTSQSHIVDIETGTILSDLAHLEKATAKKEYVYPPFENGLRNDLTRLKYKRKDAGREINYGINTAELGGGLALTGLAANCVLKRRKKHLESAKTKVQIRA